MWCRLAMYSLYTILAATRECGCERRRCSRNSFRNDCEKPSMTARRAASSLSSPASLVQTTPYRPLDTGEHAQRTRVGCAGMMGTARPPRLQESKHVTTCHMTGAARRDALCSGIWPNTSIWRLCDSLVWWHLKPFSSRHCLLHIWQYQRSFCRPLALMRFAICGRTRALFTAGTPVQTLVMLRVNRPCCALARFWARRSLPSPPLSPCLHTTGCLQLRTVSSGTYSEPSLGKLLLSNC